MTLRQSLLSHLREMSQWLSRRVNQTAALPLRNRLRRLRVVREITLSISRLKQVPKWIQHAVVILIAAIAQTYTAIIVNWLFPAWSNRQIDLFLCWWYHNKMYPTWYLYYISQDIEKLLITYAFAKVAANLSNYLFLVLVIILGYRIIDVLMLVWNFKRYELIYVDLFWTMLTLIWTVFKGYKPETISKIKSLF